VQHALDVVSFKGNLHALDRSCGKPGRLLVALEHLAMQVDLLLIVILKDRVLPFDEMLGRAPVKLARRFAMTGLLGRSGHFLQPSTVFGQDAGNHAVRLHFGRNGTGFIGEVLHPPGGLHHPVKHPLLIVALAFTADSHSGFPFTMGMNRAVI
jgi:hypothetical protein